MRVGNYKRGENHPNWKGGITQDISLYRHIYRQKPEQKQHIKEYGHKYHQREKAKVREWHREYRKLHRKEIKEWQRKDRKSHREERNEKQKIWRHQKGISKNFGGCRGGKSDTLEYRRLYRKQYKYRKKMAGELKIETIQRVYEDNIKKFGTLTCYLCLYPIIFGEDHLEHKTPLSRGGTNERDNLDIACQRCNNKKYTKTEEEYRKELLKR